MKTHELKTWPKPFKHVCSGWKTYEFRKNDRGGFCVGDVLRLREYDPDAKTYTGKQRDVRVTHMTDCGNYGIPGYVVMGIKKIRRVAPTAEKTK